MPVGVYQRPTVEDRFWKYVNKKGPIHPVCGQCWVWTGDTTGAYGYGRLRVNGKGCLAHRVSWTIHHGCIPGGQLVLHKCDTALCINPTHLFLGDHLANAADRNAKGRHSKGEDRPASKLTESQIKEIRDRYHRKSYLVSNTVALAAEFGVHPETIRYIVRRQAWQHV